MARFRYRLAPLLKIRENVRAERQTELSKAYEAQRIVNEQLEKVKNDIADCLNEGRESILAGRVRIDHLLALRRHEAHLLAQQAHAEGQLVEIGKEIERRRIALMEADREVKVLEKLKEKMKERHHQEELKAELKQMDEIAGRQRKPQTV